MTHRQTLSILDTAVACARDFIGIEEVGGDNQGPAVSWFLKAADLSPGLPWCACFVNRVVEIACAIHNIESPLERVPLQGYVQSYFEYGVDNDWLVDWKHARPGCLFLIWFPIKQRYAHIGFMEKLLLAGEEFRTVEGNSNEIGSREGYKVAQNWRDNGPRLSYIDWTRGLNNAS